jgi:WD40 repeat protein/predicted Ser/Thr protein kinase
MADLHCYNDQCNVIIQRTDPVCPNCGSPQILNRIYRVQGILGSGGFGCVYDAVDTYMNHRHCAIKEIIARPPTLTHQQIMHEIHLLSSHASNLPFMPDIYTYWDENPKHYIVMQYIDGQTIDTLWRPWDASRVLHFVLEMLGHLIQLHAVGIIHRDIKPNNIKHTTRRGYVLLDFGLATQNSGTVIQGGTPDYAPIEQFYEKRPANVHIGPWSDLYSLAVTAYYLLTNIKPARADERHQGRSLEPLHHHTNIPTAFKEILLWMLALMPENRPESAQAVLDSLKDLDLRLLAVDQPAISDSGKMPTLLGNLSSDTPGQPERLDTHTTYPRVLPDRGRLNDIAWSPDGRQIAVASALGFSVYDLPKQTERFFKELQTSVRQLTYTLDGKALALATPGGVQICQFGEQQQFTLLGSSILSTEYSLVGAPRSQVLVTATDTEVILWQTHLSEPIHLHYKDLASQLALSPNGEYLAIATHDSINIWHLHDGHPRMLRSLPFTAPIVGMAFSRDASFLAAATPQHVSLWRRDGQQIYTIDDFGTDIVRVALAPDGKTLAIAGVGQIELRRVEAQQHRHIPVDGLGPLIGLEFAPDGTHLAMCSHAQLVVWRVSDSSQSLSRQDHLESMHSVVFSPDGQHLAAMGGRVHLWKLSEATVKPPHTLFAGQSDRRNGLAFDPDGRILASASLEGIRLWDVDTGALLGEIPSGAAQAHGVAFADSGQTLLNIGADAIEWWRIGETIPSRMAQQPMDSTSNVTIAHGGAALAIFAGHTIEIHHSDGSHYSLPRIENEINGVALTQDGQRIAVATDEDTQIWAIDDAPYLLLRRGEWAQQVVFAPDGKHLALLRDQTILLWPVEDGASKQLQPLDGHTDMVNDVAFAPDGRMLASASQDGTVRLWIVRAPSAAPIEQSLQHHQVGLDKPARAPIVATPLRENTSKGEKQIFAELVPHEDHEPAFFLPPHLAPTESSSLLISSEVLDQHQIFERFILHEDYERLWKAFAYAHAGRRYLLTGYGPFGGTSLVKGAMEKARRELQQSGYADGSLLAIHFKVIEETPNAFEVQAHTLTVGHPDLPNYLEGKAQQGMDFNDVHHRFFSASLSLEDPIDMNFFDISGNTVIGAASKARKYDFMQFINDIRLFIKENQEELIFRRIISRFIGSDALNTRLLLIIDKIRFFETMISLNKSTLLRNNRVMVVVVARKEDFDRWSEKSLYLEQIGFEKWYVPCLWKVNFEDLLVQVEMSQSERYSKQRNIFWKHLEYKGRGSFGRIMDELRSPRNMHYKPGSGFIDVEHLSERTEVRHNAWMQEVLEMNWNTILGNLFRGKNQDDRMDRAKIGVYYIIDLISVNNFLTEKDVLDESKKTFITISDSNTVISEVVRNVLHVLVYSKYIKLENGHYIIIWSKDSSPMPRTAPMRSRKGNRKRNDVNIGEVTNRYQINRTKFRDLLMMCFDDSELKLLCFDVGIDYENLPGQGKINKAQDLIDYAERHGRTDDLVVKCSALRTHIDWQQVYQSTPP